MTDTVIIHTDEIALKGGNRRLFERLLEEDIMRKLGDLRPAAARSRKGSVVLRYDRPLDPHAAAMIADRLSAVFGIAHFLLATSTTKHIQAIASAAARLMEGRTGTFAVTAKRSDKSFPEDSLEICRRVGAAVLDAVECLTVDLDAPDNIVHIEVNADGAFVSTTRHKGAGGLPSGSAGTVAALLSGGFDSPVAAWKMMRRGCLVVPIHFHSYPYVGAESVDKVKRLAARLAVFQPDMTLRLVPFGDLQRAVTAVAGERMRVVLYRRFMMRIAERIAVGAGAQALVTGDSIGQVASQTLENIRAVSAAASLPVLRPLAGDDKRDIIAAARRIGTYGVSAEPHEDCCSLFVPDRPELRATAEAAEREESRLDVDGLVDDALRRTEPLEVTREAAPATVTAH